MTLVFQMAAAVLGKERTFPFQTYPMYSGYHGEGEHLATEQTVYGVLAEGGEIVISAVDIFPEIGDKVLCYFIFSRNFVSRIRAEDRAAVDRRLAPYTKRTGQRIVALRVENSPFIITYDGLRPAPPEVLKVLRLDRSEVATK